MMPVLTDEFTGPKIASEIPDLRIIINHCAGIKMDGEDPEPKAVDIMRRAADHPNVFCKLSGMMDLRCMIRSGSARSGHGCLTSIDRSFPSLDRENCEKGVKNFQSGKFRKNYTVMP